MMIRFFQGFYRGGDDVSLWSPCICLLHWYRNSVSPSECQAVVFACIKSVLQQEVWGGEEVTLAFWGCLFFFFSQCSLFHCAGSSVLMAECEPGPEIQLKHKYYPGLLLSRISSPNGYNMYLHNNNAITEVGKKERGTLRKRCPFLLIILFLKKDS